MPEYQTRHLEARMPLRHGNKEVARGERFEATPIDASYFVSRNRADDITEKVERERAAAAAAVKSAKKPRGGNLPPPTNDPPIDPVPGPALDSPADPAPSGDLYGDQLGDS